LLFLLAKEKKKERKKEKKEKKKDWKTLLLTYESLCLKLVFFVNSRGKTLESRQKGFYSTETSQKTKCLVYL